MSKVAINGMGRIGRAALKVILEQKDLDVVAVNDLVPIENVAYLLNYDTVYGRYKDRVEVQKSALQIQNKTITYLSEKDPEKLPWKTMEIDLVLECTGRFTKEEDLKKHLKAGAKHVILSAPTNSPEMTTVVFGTGPEVSTDIQAISCASCTTNCITPVVEIINRHLGIKKAGMTTIHAYTASQSLVDAPAKKMRRGRAGAANLVPTSTGAAIATTKVLPELEGKFNGVAVRAPVPVGSLADITMLVEKETSVEDVNRIFKEEAKGERYREAITVTEDEIVSSDIVQNPYGSIIDLTMTQVIDKDLVKVMSWYDNEWGYVNQMIRQAVKLLSK